jgi:hypothetical protein
VPVHHKPVQSLALRARVRVHHKGKRSRFPVNPFFRFESLWLPFTAALLASLVAMTLTFEISKRNLTETITGPTLMTSEKNQTDRPSRLPLTE